MNEPRPPRRRDERRKDSGLEGDLPQPRPQDRPGIDVPEIQRHPVGPEDEERNAPDDPQVN